VLELFEKRMEGKGAQKINTEDEQEDEEEIPFDTLLGYLSSNDTASFEKYFDGLGIYEAERIRVQVLKMFEDQKPKSK